MFTRRVKLSIIIVLLVSVHVYGTPTAGQVSIPSYRFLCPQQFVITPDHNQYIEPLLSCQENSAFTSTHVNSLLSISASNNIRQLPALPAAIIMVIIGFLCITLTIDKHFWFTRITFIIDRGHITIYALPRFAVNVCKNIQHNNQSKLSSKLIFLSKDKNRLRSKIDGNSYVGLLRHLAGIPNLDREIHFQSELWPYQINNLPVCELRRSINNRRPYHFCIKYISVLTDKSILGFSPAFIFENQARGPPFLYRIKYIYSRVYSRNTHEFLFCIFY